MFHSLRASRVSLHASSSQQPFQAAMHGCRSWEWAHCCGEREQVMWRSHSCCAGSFSFQGWLQAGRQKISRWKTWLMSLFIAEQLAHPSTFPQARTHTHTHTHTHRCTHAHICMKYSLYSFHSFNKFMYNSRTAPLPFDWDFILFKTLVWIFLSSCLCFSLYSPETKQSQER